jgi:acetyl/propionyl-CoA carboxylase alpha subunit
MNTRLQVEHPVTEAITGIDLVNEQIRVASGAGLSVTQDDINVSWPRHRMPHQCRGSGHLRPLARHHHSLPPPGGLGVRVDSGVYQGYKIPPYYDSLIGKLIVHGRTRVECMMRLGARLTNSWSTGSTPRSRCSKIFWPTRTSQMATMTSTGLKSSLQPRQGKNPDLKPARGG